MFSVDMNGNNKQSSVVEIIADELTDIENLPTAYGIGSTCICLEDSSVYMLGNDKQWHEL